MDEVRAKRPTYSDEFKRDAVRLVVEVFLQSGLLGGGRLRCDIAGVASQAGSTA